MLLALGLFVFEMASLPFQELERRRSWRFAGTDRVGARPATQFLGPGDDSVSLEGALYPAIAGDPSSIETLAEMADGGTSWSLVDGLGRVFGDFVIVGLDTRGSAFLEEGVPRRTDFTVALQRVA